MASWRQRKKGGSWEIKVFIDADNKGNKVYKYKTWRPPAGMTMAKQKKEVERVAFQFEEECKHGKYMDGEIKLNAFIEQWFDKTDSNHKERYNQRNRTLVPRINDFLGNIRLCDLQPYTIQSFYKSLSGEDVRKDGKYRTRDGFQKMVKERDFTTSTLAKTAGIGERTARDAIGGHNINRSTAMRISEAINEPLTKWFVPVNQEYKALSPATVRRYHAFLHSVLETAVKWGAIEKNPCDGVELPKTRKKEISYLDEKQAVELLRLMDEMDDGTYRMKTFKAIVYLLMFTGLRRGEACALKWSDLDFEQKTLTVTRNALYTPEKGVFIDTPKSETSQREISISDGLIQVLKEYGELQKSEKRALAQKWAGGSWTDGDWVFTRWDGQPLHPDTLTKWFSNFIKGTDLPNITLHSLRHTSATLLISAGREDIRTVSARLGHAQTSTTMNVYSHLTKSADERAAETLDEILITRNRRAVAR